MSQIGKINNEVRQLKEHNELINNELENMVNSDNLMRATLSPTKDYTSFKQKQSELLSESKRMMVENKMS